MRFLLKIILTGILSLGGYWLYKKSKRATEIEEQTGPGEEAKTTSKAQPQRRAEKRGGKDSPEQIIERLAKIDGVTTRVAENLFEKGITTKEALMKLSEEELRSVKGIGPKRAAKILNL